MHHFITEGYVLPNQTHIYWTVMIVLYPYITGIVAGAFIISSLHHVFDKDELKPVSRFAMVMAFAFLLFATLPLLNHLGHPERALNIMFTPNVTSAMAGFGFIYSTYLFILAVEIWLVYRTDIVHLYRETKFPALRPVYYALALGVLDISKESEEVDHKVMIFLASIGIPAACGLHGYVGFIFGAIKANPWWASPLMPVIFLLSAIVSGVAMVLICYIVIQWLNGREINGECVHALIETAWYFLIIDVTLELLELINHAYMANEDWAILKTLVTTKLFVSMFIIQILLGSVVPFFAMGAVVVFKQRVPAMVRNVIGVVCGVLLLAQVGAMRWNVVMGGQMFSKSLRGFLNFDVDIGGREGLLAGMVVFTLPFVVIFVFSRLLPLWGNVDTFPKEWMQEKPQERQPLKGWSKFSS